jgi:glycosyltransferase involved in cell wall biosynthesis
MGLSFSIITPSFNQGRFLDRTLQSVLSQGISEMDYLVVDGGSTDETLPILERYRGRLRWRSEPDRGQAHAVNKGFRLTSGDIIGWLNSDDVYYPGALAAVEDFFSRNPQAEILYGEADHIDAADRVIGAYPTEDWDFDRLKEICFLCQPAVFFRRRLIHRYGPLDESLQYCMDYEYWLRVGRATPFYRLNRPLAGSRMYPENKTLGERVAVHKEMNHMLRRSLGRVPAKWVFAYAHVWINRRPVDRSTRAKNLAYVFQLALVAAAGFFRWRQFPWETDWATIRQWSRGAFRSMDRTSERGKR